MSDSILAIDPGPEKSAWMLYRDGKPYRFGTEPNTNMARWLGDRTLLGAQDAAVIEMIASYGMAVGREVFETCVWIGRFMEVLGGNAVFRITRGEVKDAICGSRRATDANIRAELINRFGPGKDKAIGKKKTPGPLYGIKGDEWAALAVAVAWSERKPT